MPDILRMSKSPTDKPEGNSAQKCEIFFIQVSDRIFNNLSTAASRFRLYQVLTILFNFKKQVTYGYGYVGEALKGKRDYLAIFRFCIFVLIVPLAYR